MKKLAILGSTGSIGRQTLEIIDDNPDLFKVVSLSVNRNISLLAEQVKKYRPELVCVYDEEAAKNFSEVLNALKTSGGINTKLAAALFFFNLL